MKGVERFLNARGFVAMRPVVLTDKPSFTGWINIGPWKLQLELRFPEGKFNFPSAILPEWEHSPKIRSAFGYRHINARGRVCYVDESQSWWDSSMASEMVAGALEKIEKLLNDNLAGAEFDEVIIRDFGGYWDGAQSLFVARQVQKGKQFSQVQEKLTKSQWLVPKGEKNWIQIDTSKSSHMPWLTMRLVAPTVSLNPIFWPPSTLSQVLEWIDQSSSSNIIQLVALIRKSVIVQGKKRQENYSKEIGVALIWPNHQGIDTLGCGFSFTIPEIPAQAIGHSRLKQAAQMLKKDGSPITRYSLRRADPNYIQTRNVHDVDTLLKNKRVILVGVGTIGSQMAKLLCAHNAGWGTRGELHLVDSDIFSVENIGRHLLGAGSLNKSKATEMTARLQRDFPYLNITAHPNSIVESWNLITNNCIVIDATGCQTVSIAIPDFLSTKKLEPLVLHTWVHGHGTATVALLNDRKARGTACFRCLWRIEKNTYQPRYPISKNPEQDKPVFAGCHNSYHAYTSTVSMIAAAQAMDLLHDHLLGRTNKTLRFQILDSDKCQNRPDTKPSTARDCPLCCQ